VAGPRSSDVCGRGRGAPATPANDHVADWAARGREKADGMLVTVRAFLEDGRVIELARDVGDEEGLSPGQLLGREAHDGVLSLSDSEQVPLDSMAHAEFGAKGAP